MVSQEEFNNLAQHVRNQDGTIRVPREHLDAAGRRMIALAKHSRVHFGKELRPDAYDGKDAAEFKNWRLKVANYMSSVEYDIATEILDWAGKQKKE